MKKTLLVVINLLVISGGIALALNTTYTFYKSVIAYLVLPAANGLGAAVFVLGLWQLIVLVLIGFSISWSVRHIKKILK